MSRSLKFLIALYVLVYLIGYQGKHFKVYQVQGVSQISFNHPTKRMCNPKLRNCHSNFTRFDELAYCEGAPSDKNVKQLPCRYYDGMGLPIEYRKGILVPTRVRQYNQKRGEDCQPDKSNGYQCERIWEYVDSEGNFQTDTKPKPLEQHFVADVERFTVMFDHSYATPELGLGNDDYQMQGYWMDCEHEGKGKLKPVNCKKRPIICMKGKKCKPWMVTDENVPKQSPSQSFLASGSVLADDDEENEFGDDIADDDDEMDFHEQSSRLADGIDQNIRSIEGHRLLNSGRHHRHHRHVHEVIDEIREPEVAPVQQTSASLPAISSLQMKSNQSSGLHPVVSLMQEVDHDATPVVSISHGDVMTIGHLLKMAGVGLDDPHFRKTFRETGLVLVVTITYSNKKPWQLWSTIDPAEYIIKVSRRPAYEYQLDLPISSLSNNEREYTSYHGIYVVIEQQGEMQGFSFVHLLVILSGALSLLKLSSTATDYAACHLISNHEEVRSLKYEESRDFYPEN
jgi:hypothetical protein